MPHGKLAAYDLIGGVVQSVHRCTTDKYNVLTVSICNRGTVDAEVTIAITDNESIMLNDVILDYQAIVPPNGVLERSKIVAEQGKFITVLSSASQVSAVVWGAVVGDEVSYPAIVTEVDDDAPTFQVPTSFNYPYTDNVRAYDNSQYVTYSIISGALPTGVTLNTSTGVLSGSAAAGQVATVGIRATDPSGNFSDRTFTITTVEPPTPLEPPPPPPPPGEEEEALPSIPTPYMWYKNDDIASLGNGSSITNWVNQGSAGSSFNLNSSGNASYPSKTTDSGFAAAYFNGSQYLAWGSNGNWNLIPNSSTTNKTLFIVYRETSGGYFGFLGRYGYDSNNGSIGMWPQSGSNRYVHVHQNDGFPVSFDMPDDSNILQRGVRLNTSGQIAYWDGSTGGYNTTSYSGYGSDLYVAGIGTSRTSYNYGYLYEMIIYDSALSDSDINTVRTYLQAKFSV